MVTVQVYGTTLRQRVDESEVQVEVTGPTTVRQLLEAHPDKLAHVLDYLHRGEVLITINRKVGTQDSLVRDGDLLKLSHQFNPVYEGARWHNP